MKIINNIQVAITLVVIAVTTVGYGRLWGQNSKEKTQGEILKAYFEKNGHEEFASDEDLLCQGLKEVGQMAEKAQDPVIQMILHSYIADGYRFFEEKNFHKLKDRTSLEKNSSEDIREWDIKKLQEAGIEQIELSLKDIKALHKTSMRKYVPFSEIKSDGKYFKHDILNIVFKKAKENLWYIKIHSSTEATKEYADSLINDITSSVLALYKADDCNEAVILLSLEDIDTKNSFLYEKRIEAKKRLLELFKDSPLKAEILFSQALDYLSDNQVDSNKVKALELLDTIINKYPAYQKIEMVKEQKNRILREEINYSFPTFAYPKEEIELLISYCNIKEFNLEIYKAPKELEDKLLIDPNYIPDTKEHLSYIKGKKPIQVSHYQLDDTPDYEHANKALKLKAPKLGCYIVTIDKNRKNFTLLRSTTLMPIILDREKDLAELLVTDRLSGNPVKGVAYKVHTRRRVGARDSLASGKVNETGRATLTLEKGTHTVITLTLGEDKFSYITAPYKPYQNYSKEPDKERVEIWSDRVIYRPGQTLSIAGIVYRQEGDSLEVVKNKTIDLSVIYGERRDTKNVTTNDFGSFSENFTLPKNIKNGHYVVRAGLTTGLIFAKKDIWIQEYKRPTFEVKISPLAESYKLGDSVTISGTALSYAGSPINASKASYKVVRRKFWGIRNYDQEAITDNADFTLNPDGSFSFKTKLKKETDGLSIYNIEVEVISLGGETQTATSDIIAGKQDIVVNLEGFSNTLLCKDKPITFTFKTCNLLGYAVESKVKYELRKFDDKKEGECIENKEVISNEKIDFASWKSLPSGKYLLKYGLNDSLTNKKELALFSKYDKAPIKGENLWVYKDNDTVYYGTSNCNSTIYMDIFTKDKCLSSKNIPVSNSINSILLPYKEEYGDGATVKFLTAKNSRIYTSNITVAKPTPDNALRLKWKVFRNRLQAGQKEEWALSVTDKEGKPAKAELLAFMYDASLEVYKKYNLYNFIRFPRNLFWGNWQGNRDFNSLWYSKPIASAKPYNYAFDRFITDDDFVYSRPFTLMHRTASTKSADGALVQNNAVAKESIHIRGYGEEEISLRKNFAESAFFYPHLRADSQGVIKIAFTLPQSLTSWRFKGVSHTQNMQLGLIDTTITASKEFMLQPDLPRFLRSQDTVELTGTLTNLSKEKSQTEVIYEVFEPLTEKIIAIYKARVSIDSEEVSALPVFKYKVPSNYTALGVRVMATGLKFSDGEQHLLAVLPDKEHFIESIPISIKEEGTQNISLKNLFNKQSKSATDKTLTIEATANPIWYAIEALAPLSKVNSSCAIDWCNALYATYLAKYIVNSDKSIKKIISAWQTSPESDSIFESQLNKNEELKTILQSETPWEVEAKNEKMQRQEIIALFDENNIADKLNSAIENLQAMQLPNGSFSWYKGMGESLFTTTYILTQLSHLQEITTISQKSETVEKIYNKALNYLHRQVKNEYEYLLKHTDYAKEYQPNSLIINYLYIVAMQPKSYKAPSEYSNSYNYFLQKLSNLERIPNLKQRALASIILNKAGYSQKALSHLNSLKQYIRATNDLSTQVAAIEAISKVAPDSLKIEQIQTWILEQKRTQMWKTSPQTAEAVYALISGVTDNKSAPANLQESALNIKIAGQTLSTTDNNAIPGFNYIKRQFTDTKTVTACNVTLTKSGKSLSWGAIYAGFNDKLSKASLHGNKDISISKELYIKKLQKAGEAEELQKITPKTLVNVGDKIVARLIIKTSRNLEFVQLKANCPVGLEPTDRLSGYCFKGGMGFYREIRDASENFFFDWLNKGVYILEIEYRAANAGSYEAGLASLQCAYAPEFTAHSASQTLRIGRPY